MESGTSTGYFSNSTGAPLTSSSPVHCNSHSLDSEWLSYTVWVWCGLGWIGMGRNYGGRAFIMWWRHVGRVTLSLCLCFCKGGWAWHPSWSTQNVGPCDANVCGGSETSPSVQSWSLQCPSNMIWPFKIYLSPNNPLKCNPKLEMKMSLEVLTMICPPQESTSAGYCHYI